MTDPACTAAAEPSTSSAGASPQPRCGFHPARPHSFLDTPSAGPGGVRGRQFLLNAMALIAERRASSAHLRRQRELTRTERARAATSMRCFATSMPSPRNAEGGPAAGMEQAQSCATARALELFLGSWHSGCCTRFGTITSAAPMDLNAAASEVATNWL